MRESILKKTIATWLLALGLSLHCLTVTGQEATEAAAAAETEAVDGNDADSAETQTSEQRTPPAVYIAAKQGKLKRLQILIAEGADVNATNSSGRTALMGATYFRNVRIIHELLIEGANVDAKDNNGRTALMIAVKNEDRDLAMMLLDAGADVSVADNRNQTVLMLAESLEDKELAKLLESAKPAETTE